MQHWQSEQECGMCMVVLQQILAVLCKMFSIAFMLFRMTAKRYFPITLQMPVRLTTTTATSLNESTGPCWGVSRHAKNLTEDTLSTYYICNLSTIIHILNSFCNKFLQTFFLSLVCGNCAQSLSASFNYILHIFVHEGMSKHTCTLPISHPSHSSQAQKFQTLTFLIALQRCVCARARVCVCVCVCVCVYI
jgi:hypothetical protein